MSQTNNSFLHSLSSFFSKKEYINIVDKNNTILGKREKLDVHKKGLLHRAFSILIFNDKDELLIQRRAIQKYHCGGIWANTVCSHPRHKETYHEAIHRRMHDEIGFDTRLKKLFSFIYKTKFENGLTEFEHDTVFVGKYNNEPNPNPEEIMDYKWITLKELKADIKDNPKKYASWFKIIIRKIDEQNIKNELKNTLKSL